MKAAIIASSVISPQLTHNTNDFPAEITEIVADRLTCIEPDYRNLINPLQLRRMPRILKMGLASSQTCINRAGGISPDAIIMGTGLGCLDNLEKFLLDMLNSKEHVTSVLPFINSTHNAVAAQVAMLLKNHNYNITYCHRGFSFESALLDALMQIEEKPEKNILVGGIDECTSDFMKLHGYLDYWKKPQSNLRLLTDRSYGTIAGEGSAFFMMSGETGTGRPQAIIDGVHTFFIPHIEGSAEILKEIGRFLQRSHLELQDIDCVLLGLNGDSQLDTIYYTLQNNCFSDHTEFLYYKHLCGEYYTSSAFALWLGSVILEQQHIPDVVRLTRKPAHAIRNLLIYNHIRNTEHSLILMKYGRF
jgi:3-oxoacyl-[acyl-carrier-protein] synthase II